MLFQAYSYYSTPTHKRSQWVHGDAGAPPRARIQNISGIISRGKLYVHPRGRELKVLLGGERCGMVN